MKQTITTLSAFAIAAATSQAAVIVTTALNIATTGQYADGAASPANEVLTSQTYNGATFDIIYTVGARATGANPFVNSNGVAYGVGSDGDITNHYGTLEGDDGEGLAFTGLGITNFVAGTSGLTAADFTNLEFTTVDFGAAGNNQDGVNYSYTGYNVTPSNQNLSGAVQSITAAAGNTNLYLTPDNGNGSNRWNVNGLGVQYCAPPIPEPSSSALLLGGLGMLGLVRRRK